MQRSIIIFGPQRCGKTRNAERLRKFYGLHGILDDWDGHSPIPPDTLVLTNVQPQDSQNANAVSYYFAIRALTQKESV